MKTVAVRNIKRTDAGLAARLGAAGASTVHEAQGRTGLMDPVLRPIYPNARIGGTAVTILAAPGDIRVVDRRLAPRECAARPPHVDRGKLSRLIQQTKE